MNVMRGLAAVIAAPCLSATALAAQSASARPITLEYRWVGEHVAGPTHTAPRPATFTFVQVSDSVALTLADVDTAEVGTRGPSGAEVFVRLTPRGAQRFADATAAHVGRELAVLLDGEVVQVATIESRLGRVAGVLAGVPRDSAIAVAARINASRTPRPPTS